MIIRFRDRLFNIDLLWKTTIMDDHQLRLYPVGDVWLEFNHQSHAAALQTLEELYQVIQAAQHPGRPINI